MIIFLFIELYIVHDVLKFYYYFGPEFTRTTQKPKIYDTKIKPIFLL